MENKVQINRKIKICSGPQLAWEKGGGGGEREKDFPTLFAISKKVP